MPLFVCNDCGTVDNTALANYWLAVGGTDGEPEPPRCSACAPGQALDGSGWHGQFPRRHWRDFVLENPADGRDLLNLRPCFCGADPLSHDYANPRMPHKGTGCAGYSPVPWQPCHARPRA
jgi:hypothetical protein